LTLFTALPQNRSKARLFAMKSGSKHQSSPIAAARPCAATAPEIAAKYPPCLEHYRMPGQGLPALGKKLPYAYAQHEKS